ncbi:MAG: hypothetical protein GY934_04065 [Gammaproteobacteria bacterium]|nr:hypothetical protein [Gammaproteobacteria bacterium]
MMHSSSTIRFITVTLFSLLLLPHLSSADTSVRLTKASGGGGGSPFVEMATPQGEIVAITVRSGNFIDSVTLTYRYGNRRVNGPRHGGNGGSQRTFKLKKGERIIELGGRSGKYVDSLYIRTNKNRTQRWGGQGGSSSYRFTASKNAPIVGLWGRSGAFLDAIGAIKASGRGKALQTDGLAGYSREEDASRSDDGGQDGIHKRAAIQTHEFPAPNDNRDELDQWLSNQSNMLLKIVKKLANSPNDYNKYLSKENAYCQAQPYCELAYRRGAISHVTRAE